MHKKTSTIMALTIATILTASALILSNQAFAQSSTIHNSQSQSVTGALHSGKVLGGHVAQLGSFTDRVQSTQAHLGQALGGITTTIHNIIKGGSTNRLGIAETAWSFNAVHLGIDPGQLFRNPR
jgi:hypothetical protein